MVSQEQNVADAVIKIVFVNALAKELIITTAAVLSQLNFQNVKEMCS